MIAQNYPGHRMYDPACLHCGARLIRVLGTLPIAVSECQARRRSVLADWMAMGHAEKDLRELAKGQAPCIGQVSASVCADPPRTKRR